MGDEMTGKTVEVLRLNDEIGTAMALHAETDVRGNVLELSLCTRNSTLSVVPRGAGGDGLLDMIVKASATKNKFALVGKASDGAREFWIVSPEEYETNQLREILRALLLGRLKVEEQIDGPKLVTTW